MGRHSDIRGLKVVGAREEQGVLEVNTGFAGGGEVGFGK